MRITLRCPTLVAVALGALRPGAAQLAAQQPADTAGLVALLGVQLFPGTGSTLIRNRTILIEHGVIRAIFPADSAPLPLGTRLLDYRGRYVIPGLIDTHVHVATDPDSEDTRQRSELRLRAALEGGVTGVRDMAGDARTLAGLARDSRLDRIASPDLYYAALFAGPEFFADPRTQSASRGLPPGAAPWMRAITTETDLPLAVAEAKGTGASAIKLYAALDSALAAAIVREAHRQGLLVWAHAALNPATPAQVVGAGVDAVSHAGLLARAMSPSERELVRQRAESGETVNLDSPSLDRVLRLMARRGVVLDPTLFIESRPGMLELEAQLVARAHREGVPISVGTDSVAAAEPGAVPNIHDEMWRLVSRAGFTPAEALLAATRNGATTLGILDRTGTVEPGKQADLVVLKENPLVDIRRTREIELVIKHGRIYRPR